MNYLARCVSPYSFEYAAKLHDAMTQVYLCPDIGLRLYDDFTWNQASLNIKLGGFGLSEVNKSKCSAYVSSWAQSVRDLPNRFSSLSQCIQDLVENNSTSASLGFDVHSAVKSLLPVRLRDDETSRPQSLSTLSATKGKPQHNLSSEIGLLSAAHCLSSAPHRRDAATLRSAQGRGSGAWLEALPSSDRYALISKDFRLASFLRLGLPMPFKSCINKCECGVELDGTGYHLLTCKFGGPSLVTRFYSVRMMQLFE